MSHEANVIRLQDVTPATATRLVVLLYDGAIAALERALDAIDRGDPMRRCRSINMALDILAHLCLALDRDRGGEIAHNLTRLYGFMIGRLQRANLLNDPAPLREVVALLETLYGAWRELDRRVTEEHTLQEATRGGQAVVGAAG